ncbi:MAG: tetratricopeptide repeat protein [Myxococcota bacterium]
MSYFDRPATIAPIFASFFAIFLPVCALQIVPNFVEVLPYLFVLNAVGLGITHFIITLALYFQGPNRDYFNSSPTNRLIYFGIPLAILLFFAVTAAADVRTTFPAFSLYFFGAIRFFDFFHVGRQSFGMLQIFRRPLQGRSPSWLRRGENVFFIGMAAMQWETFVLNGRFRPDLIYVSLPAIAMAALFCSIVASYLVGEQRSRSGGRPWVPLAYFVMQALCAASAVYDIRLYLTALAMHYVEYHVIMMPRCFRAEIDPERWVDRFYARVRRHGPVFFSVLLVVLVVFEMRHHVDTQSFTATFLVHIFDGIFFMHYFVDAFLWKFHKPYYKETLTPLYFSPGATTGAADHPDRAGWIAAGVVTAGLFLAWTQGLLGDAAEEARRRTIDPIHARNHLHWGISLAQRSEWTKAERHFREAVDRNPENLPAWRLLETAQKNALIGRRAR